MHSNTCLCACVCMCMHRKTDTRATEVELLEIHACILQNCFFFLMLAPWTCVHVHTCPVHHDNLYTYILLSFIFGQNLLHQHVHKEFLHMYAFSSLHEQTYICTPTQIWAHFNLRPYPIPASVLSHILTLSNVSDSWRNSLNPLMPPSKTRYPLF